MPQPAVSWSHYVWMRAARLAWLGLAVIILALNALGLWLHFQKVRAVCETAACARWQLTGEQAAGLADRGIPFGAYLAAILSFDLLITITWIVVAFLLFLRTRELVALAGSLAMLVIGSAFFGPVSELRALGLPLTNSAVALLEVLAAVLFSFFFVFPDGRFVPRWTAWAAAAWTVICLLALALPGWGVSTSPAFSQLYLLMIALIAAAQLYRYLRVSNLIQQQQTKWAVFGFAGAFLAQFVIFGVLVPLFPALNRPFLGFDTLLTPLANVIIQLVPISLGIALLRYRLWDIDLIIRRTLVYGLLSALLAVIYFGSVVALRQILIGSASSFAIVLTTLALAALFTPLRRRIQAAIDRRFYRSRYDSQKILEGFHSRIRSEVETGALSEQLLVVVNETVQPEHVSLWIRET